MEEFSKRFENSPIRQATRDGFVRNVVVALGNSGKREAIPALEKALQDASSLVRAHAAWALGQIPEARITLILESAGANETDLAVLDEISLALALCRSSNNGSSMQAYTLGLIRQN
jgi:epoxyqueuosine reductase